MNSTKATMMKLSVSVRKLPQASTAPCFFASARLLAVTAFDSPREIVGEVEAAGDRADDRHDDVADQRSDDAAEGRADDDADREVDDIALHREFAKFLQHPQPLLFGVANRKTHGGNIERL